MKQFTSFVVEDNINALDMLVKDLSLHFNIKVIGKSTNIIGAIKQLQKINPDILFLDIMLGDGTAFDILEILPNLNSKIIFITASDEYAIKAFKFAAIDYILKPYSIEDLDLALKKVKTYINPNHQQLELLNELVKTPNKFPNKLSLHTSEKIIIVQINDIIRCQSDNNYTLFHFNNNTRLIVSKTLKYYANLLKDYGFLRVHQKHLVNKEYIKEYIKSNGGYLVLNDKSNIPVSVRKRSEILDILK